MSIKKILLILAFMLSSSISFATTLSEGESFEFSFTNIAFFGNTTATSSIGLSFNLLGDLLSLGESLQLELFEDTPSDSAFLTTTFIAPGTGFGVGTIDGLFNYWQDLQGSLRLTAISGSVNLDSFTLGVNSNGIRYFEQIDAASVPEFSSFYLFLMGFLGLIGVTVVTVIHRNLKT